VSNWNLSVHNPNPSVRNFFTLFLTFFAKTWFLDTEVTHYRVCNVVAKKVYYLSAFGDTMKYQLVERKNPLKRDEPGKLYMSPVYGNTLELKDLARDVSAGNTFSYGTTLGVLQTLIDKIPVLLKQGSIISLGNFGRFRMIPSSEGVENAKDFTAKKVRKWNLCFTPTTEVKELLKATTFQKARTLKEPSGVSEE
jgi:predicted histone-like DNA-binding protein